MERFTFNTPKELEFIGKFQAPIYILNIDKSSKCQTALYEWRNNYHEIKVWTGNLHLDVRDYKTIIVHELIHAMQQELGLEEAHGEFFQLKAKEAKELLGLENVFIDGLDI